MEKRRQYLLTFALAVVGLTIYSLYNFRNSYCYNSLLPKSKIVQRAWLSQSEKNRDSTQQIVNAYPINRVLWQNTKQISLKKGC